MTDELKVTIQATNNIFKIETKQAIKSLKVLIRTGDNFLIDRGDLSKEISIENIPFIQRKILKLSKKYKNKKKRKPNFKSEDRKR